MKNIVVISGHRDLNQSVINRIIVDEIQSQLPNVPVRKLDSLYPDFRIDIKAEQAAMQDADVIVLQFPLFWYSTPAIMKKWLDDTFLRGFSHGPDAILRGKKLLVSVTTGIGESDYTAEGLMKHDLMTYLMPLKGVAIFCGMEFLEPMSLTHVSYTHRGTEAELNQQKSDAKAYADKLIQTLKTL